VKKEIKQNGAIWACNLMTFIAANSSRMHDCLAVSKLVAGIKAEIPHESSEIIALFI
jgi:hypothetical protein